MYDLSQPIPNEVIVYSIVFILFLVVIGLGLVWYFKGKR